MANPYTDGAHLSDQDTADMIDQYGGVVDSQFAKKSFMRQFVNVQALRGTDTLINRRVGRTELNALVSGVRPDATKTKFGKASVTVDTVILARDMRSMLNEFQVDFAARKELGEDHGKEIAKFFDQALIIQTIKGALSAAPANLNSAFAAGKSENLAAAGDELDPAKLYTAIESIIVDMQTDDMDTDEGVVLVNPTQYAVLLNNDKLISRDFSKENGDFANGTFNTIMGMPVQWTNRMPQAAIPSHKLGADYNITAAEAKVTAVVMNPKSLLAAETIPLTSDVFFDKIERSWNIDSFIAFAAAPRLPGASGAVFIN